MRWEASGGVGVKGWASIKRSTPEDTTYICLTYSNDTSFSTSPNMS